MSEDVCTKSGIPVDRISADVMYSEDLNEDTTRYLNEDNCGFRYKQTRTFTHHWTLYFLLHKYRIESSAKLQYSIYYIRA